SQRLLLDSHVLIGVDQVPIQVFDLVHGGDDLQAESHVGDLAVILGDADEARVRHEAKSLQQVLGESELQTRVNQRTVCNVWLVRRQMRVVESHRKVRAPMKTLQVAE